MNSKNHNFCRNKQAHEVNTTHNERNNKTKNINSSSSTNRENEHILEQVLSDMVWHG